MLELLELLFGWLPFGTIIDEPDPAGMEEGT